MKKLLFLMIIIVAMISCESQSGKRHRDAQNILKSTTIITVKVIDGNPPRAVDINTGLVMYKTKVQRNDSSVCYILTNNQFDTNDILVIKPEQILKN